MPLVRMDGSKIRDWNSFHEVFAQTFGFPELYGRNMNAWIDCMTDLAAGEDTGMTKVWGSVQDPVVLVVDHASVMPRDLFDAIVEGVGFVNWRRIEAGEPVALMLAFWREE